MRNKYARITALRPGGLDVVYYGQLLPNGNQFHISTGFVSDDADGQRWIVGDKHTSVPPNKFKSYAAALAFLEEKEGAT